MEVSVSILKEKDNINEVIKRLNDTNTDYIHLDIMDGTFTENSSFEISEFLTIDTNKKYDVHIMSTNLDYQIKEAIKLNPEFITFHVEATSDVNKYIKMIKKENIKVGLSINPDTNLDKVSEYINDIDLLLIMSVVPGMGGQKFINKTVDKLKLINKKRDYLVSVDGGINNETKELCSDANILVSGNYVLSGNDYQERIDSLR